MISRTPSYLLFLLVVGGLLLGCGPGSLSHQKAEELLASYVEDKVEPSWIKVGIDYYGYPYPYENGGPGSVAYTDRAKSCMISRGLLTHMGFFQSQVSPSTVPRQRGTFTIQASRSFIEQIHKEYPYEDRNGLDGKWLKVYKACELNQKVTAISQEGSVAAVVFTWDYQIYNPIGKCIVENDFQDSRESKATFHKYDAGWRVEEIDCGP